MYKIYADKTLIYDSTLDDYKIRKGTVTLETNKSGSFVFSLYPDHFFYDSIVKLKTVVTVYKSNRIVFRGRVLNDVTDYWNNKVFTCGGELDFLQDSVIRPFTFSGTPAQLFSQLIQAHNSQVDAFKQFKVGTVTVVDTNNRIARENTEYESALSNISSRLLGDATGGNLYITHGDDGQDPVPTIHYLADFTTVASQVIEFGENLRDYTKTTGAEEVATAIIPLGTEVVTTTETDKETGETTTTTEETGEKLTIAEVNGGKDYIYSEEAVALRGWIFKVVEWDDVTVASNLLAKAQAYLQDIVKQTVTIELKAVDLHLLDRSIESFHLGEYVRVVSRPHGFDATMLCNKQTLDLLKPENDSLVLGHTFSTFTESSTKVVASGIVSTVKSSVASIKSQVKALDNRVVQLEGGGGGGGASLEKVYPVGSIYLSILGTNPATLFGFGTWEQIKDKFLLSAGDTYAAGSEGGEAKHTLTVDEMPSHSHEYLSAYSGSVSGVYGTYSGSVTQTNAVGGSQPHNNMPPYLSVYIWKRTA